MNLSLSLSTVMAVLLASIRAGVWLAFCPPFNNRGMPAPVKALLSVAIALPFKLLLFVLVNGWGLILTALVASYRS